MTRPPTQMEDQVARLCNHPPCTDEEWAYIKRMRANAYDDWIKKARDHTRAMYHPTPDMIAAGNAAMAGRKFGSKGHALEAVWQAGVSAASPPVTD